MFWYPKEKDYDVRDAAGVTLRDFLKTYDPNKYERPSVAVDMLVFKKSPGGLQILLIRRGRHPSFGKLALPGGFVEMDESLEDAAARELAEETGLRGVKFAQLGVFGDVGRDPRMRIISVAYTAVLEHDAMARAGDDAMDAGFYDLSIKREVINSEKIYHMTFESGMNNAYSNVSESGGKRIVIDGGVSSDHPIMILNALERLGFIENM